MRLLLSKLLSFVYSLSFRNNKLKIGYNSILFCSFTIKGNHNLVELGSLCTFRRTKITINGKNNKIIFGNGVKVYENLKILIEGDNHLIFIDSKTTIGSAKIQLAEYNTSINIGKDCMLSRDISFNTSDFHSIIDTTTKKRLNDSKDINVGNHVWIGNGVYVNKGSDIKDDSIVAARSIVSAKEFHQNSVIGGIPAKTIRENVNWDRKLI